MIRYILVDDDQNVLETVKSKIATLSEDYDLHHVMSYHSSKQAFQEINEEDYDLLIVDFEMPVYNGVELAKKIAVNKKIIFLTSTSNNEQLVINKLDISGYMSKPFELDEFEDILKNKIIGKLNLPANVNSGNLITLHIGKNKDVRFLSEKAYYISTSRNRNNEQPVKNCVHIYGENDEILFKNVRITINQLSKKLMNYGFENISQSTIINMAHVKERDNTHLSLYNCKECFEITDKEKKKFLNSLRSFFKV